MCGVVGVIGWSCSRDVRVPALRRGIRAILHRGPEEVGMYHDRDVALGTVRLSIVDPLLGKQPMITADGRYVVGFNGEIFNFVELRTELEALGVRFATRSDTEVLLQSLAQWGVDDALTRLNGQYGFAFYDRVRRELVLGRDRFGERPMFYHQRGDRVYFASEVKGIFAFDIPRRLSPSRTLAAGRFWAPIPDETCFEDIECLPQGHYLRISGGNARLVKYFDGFEAGRGAEPRAPGTFADAAAELRERLRESVRIRLRGDYPLGAFVSGGLDSAVIASEVRELVGDEIPTFSAHVDDPRLDESAHQDVVTTALGTRHSAVRVTAADVRARFPKVIEQCEMPLHRTAPVACGMLAAHVGAAGVRIVLGGEGADEVFLGYDITKEAAVLDRHPPGGRGPGAAIAAVLGDLKFTSNDTATSLDEFYSGHGPAPALGPHLRRFEAEPMASLLIGADGGTAAADERLRRWVASQAPDFSRWSQVDRAQWLDIHTLFIGYGMTCHGDRPGTGCGVETRFPFLDPSVLALAAQMPQEWKLDGAFREKHVLREAYRPSLPPSIVDRPKFGMRIPGAAALRRDGSDDWVGAILSTDSLRNSSVLDTAAVRQLLDRVERPTESVAYPDSHAYLQVLSILLLEEKLVRGFRVPEVDIDPILFKEIDGEVEQVGLPR